MRKPTGKRFVFETRRFTAAEHEDEWQRKIKYAEEALEEAKVNAPPWEYTVDV